MKCPERAHPPWVSGLAQEEMGTVGNGHRVSPRGVGNVLKLDSGTVAQHRESTKTTDLRTLNRSSLHYVKYSSVKL